MRTFLLSACLAALVLAGCGSDNNKKTVPDDAIAVVGEQEVSRGDFDRWLQMGLKATGDVTFDPPEYKQCVAEVAKQQFPDGQKPRQPQLLEMCKTTYTNAREQATQSLLIRNWVDQEAERVDVTVTDEEVEKRFAEQKKTSFRNDADYAKFLEQTGMTAEDMQERVRLELLTEKLAEHANPEKPITKDQARRYFTSNRGQFDRKKERDLQLLVVNKRGRAQQAAEQLRSGAAFQTVLDRFGTGGKVTFAAGMEDSAAAEKILASGKSGKWVGPVKSPTGFYVFKVLAARDAKKLTFTQAQEQVVQAMKTQREEKARASFSQNLQKRYAPKTVCAKDHLLMSFCSNAPKPEQNDININPNAGQPSASPAP